MTHVRNLHMYVIYTCTSFTHVRHLHMYVIYTYNVIHT